MYALDELKGEAAGVFASMVWAVNGILYSRVQAPANAMNFYKNSLATVFLGVTVLVCAVIEERVPLADVTAGALAYLAGSSAIAILFGDWFYFRSLQILGARRAAVFTTLTPISAALYQAVWLDQRTGRQTWGGMAMTLAGVVVVVLNVRREPDQEGPRPGGRALGVLCGVVAALTQCVGAFLSREGMRTVPVVEASLLRLAMAAAGGFFLGAATRQLEPWWAVLLERRNARILTVAAFSGTFLGIWCSLLAFKYADIGVATTLTTLSPVFIIPLAWVFLGQRPRSAAWVGAALAVAGVAVLTMSGPHH